LQTTTRIKTKTKKTISPTAPSQSTTTTVIQEEEQENREEHNTRRKTKKRTSQNCAGIGAGTGEEENPAPDS
jgi:hypothetical protein